MIFIISGISVTDFVERIHTLLGQKKIRYIVNCTNYELEYTFNNFKDPDTLTILGLHEKYSEDDALKWAGMFEEKFNIPVFMGTVSGLWR